MVLLLLGVLQGDLYLIAYCYFECYFICIADIRDLQNYGRSFKGKTQKHNSPVLNNELNGCGQSGTAINKI